MLRRRSWGSFGWSLGDRYGTVWMSGWGWGWGNYFAKSVWSFPYICVLGRKSGRFLHLFLHFSSYICIFDRFLHLFWPIFLLYMHFLSIFCTISHIFLLYMRFMPRNWWFFALFVPFYSLYMRFMTFFCFFFTPFCPFISPIYAFLALFLIVFYIFLCHNFSHICVFDNFSDPFLHNFIPLFACYDGKCWSFLALFWSSPGPIIAFSQFILLHFCPQFLSLYAFS